MNMSDLLSRGVSDIYTFMIYESVFIRGLWEIDSYVEAYEVLRFFGDRLVQRNTFWQVKNVIGKGQWWQKLRGPDSNKLNFKTRSLFHFFSLFFSVREVNIKKFI